MPWNHARTVANFTTLSLTAFYFFSSDWTYCKPNMPSKAEVSRVCL